MPFWRGEGPGRTLELGRSLGQLTRAIIERLDAPDRIDWLKATCALDAACARDLFRHISRQILIAGCVPDDRTILVEASRDPLGDWQLLILTPLGSRFHLGLRLALEGVLTQKLGYRPQCLHHDDGVLVRLSDSAEPPMNLLDWLDPERLEDQILTELADSPLFAIRFRQNASRALLLLPQTIRRLGKHIQYVHFRDARGTAEAFVETFHDNGPTDMAEAIRALRESGFTGPLRPDHVPQLAGEENGEPGYTMLGRLFAFGYIRGLLHATEPRMDT
jgi:Lhr-like helicase